MQRTTILSQKLKLQRYYNNSNTNIFLFFYFALYSLWRQQGLLSSQMAKYMQSCCDITVITRNHYTYRQRGCRSPMRSSTETFIAAVTAVFAVLINDCELVSRHRFLAELIFVQSARLSAGSSTSSCGKTCRLFYFWNWRSTDKMIFFLNSERQFSNYHLKWLRHCCYCSVE